MLKLIFADFYKVFHRTYFYVLTLVLAALAVFVVVSLHTGSPQADTVSVALQLALQYLVMPVMVLPCLTDIVLNEEYREHTAKNTMAYGTNRVMLYSAKLITAFLLGVLMMVVVLGLYFAASMVLLQHDAALTGALLGEFFIRIAASCVVYAACLGMAAFFSTLCSRNTLWLFLFYGAFLFSDLLLKLLRLDGGTAYLLKTQILSVSGNPVNQLLRPVLISLATLVLFYAAGTVLFCKKDMS